MGLIALAAPADAQKRGGTLTIVRPTDPVSLDPHTETTAPGAWVYYNILEPLIYLDEKMTIQPRLATSYEVMSPTKVRFKLRPNVKFHDGTPFNAAAVKFTFERAFKSTPPARWASLAGPIAGAEVVDDLTVDIVTKEPYGPILRSMAMLYVSIVSPTAVQKLGEGALRAPVGTGPFKFVEWKTNTQIVIERNPDYWGEKALLDRVVFKVVPEEGARMIALQTGDADMVMFPSPAQLPTFKKDAKYTVHEAPGLRVVYVGLQHQAARRSTTSRVRQALLQAVDRKAILENIVEGWACRAKSYLSPGVFGYKDMQFDQALPVRPGQGQGAARPGRLDPGAGRHPPEGRAEAHPELDRPARPLPEGRGDHRGRPADVEGGRGRRQGRVPGVGDRLQRVQADGLRAGTTGRSAGRRPTPTPTTRSSPCTTRQQLTPTGWNRTRYANPKVDQLLEAARRSLNQSEREKLYGEVQDILAKDTLWIPVYNTKEIVITRANVKGYVIHPVEYNLGLWKTWIDK